MVASPTSRWWSASVLGVALVALSAGFGSFGAVAALGDVAKTFGHHAATASVHDEAGLSGSTIGVGLAILRFASLFAMPLAMAADRLGRRRTLLGYCALGLCCTTLAALSPGYWWFVAIFAFGRPLFSAAVAICQVAAAELTSSSARASGLALVTAGYGSGAGLAALVHTGLTRVGGFRLEFALALIPLIGLIGVRRLVVEPVRWSSSDHEHHARIGRVDRSQVWRLLTVAVLGFSISAASGPANGFIYLYADDVVRAAPSTVATMVAISAVTGIVGLQLGRWGADRWGRRPVVAVASASYVTAAVLAYGGTVAELIAGFLGAILAAGALAPAATSLANELFPTEVRAAVAGWNIAAGVLGGVAGSVLFGVLVDQTSSYRIAAMWAFLPTLIPLLLLRTLPETRGVEPEVLWPERNPVGLS